jgi:hypothetical protein
MLGKLWKNVFGKVDPVDDIVSEVIEARAVKARAEAENRQAASRVEGAVGRLLDEYQRLRAAEVSRTMREHPPAHY